MSEQEKPPTYGEAMQQENKGAWPSDPGRPLAPSAGWSQSFPPPPPNYGATNVVVSEPVVFPATQVIIVGGCPACRVGILEDNFSCLGVLCAILFFPIGILCCLAMRDKRCTNCGAIF